MKRIYEDSDTIAQPTRRQVLQQVVDWAVWFNNNRDNDMGLQERMKFLETAVDGCMRCVVDLVFEHEGKDAGKKFISSLHG